jgi:hypothetical protein
MMVAVATLANAQEAQYASHAEMMSLIEAQNTRLASLEAGLGAGQKTDGKYDACCDCGSWFAETEVTFFKYHRADGVRVGDTYLPFEGAEDVEFDFEASPRITLGYTQGCRGLRVRWWEYDQTAPAAVPNDDGPQQLTIDTYTIDLEFFQSAEIACGWDIELSAGVRYNDFEEVLRDGPEFRINSFSGFGLTMGLESRHGIGRWGDVFVRGRGAILMDDKYVKNFRTPGDKTLKDTVQGAVELAVGYEYTRCLDWATLTLGVSYELQQWVNYSSAFDKMSVNADWTSQGVNAEDYFDGQSDVGFTGLVLSAALSF